MQAHKRFQLKAQNLELAVDRYMHPRMTEMHKNSYERRACESVYIDDLRLYLKNQLTTKFGH